MAAPFSFVQTCYVVDDLETACQRFHKTFGLGPFLGGAPISLGGHVYRGAPAEPIRIKGVFVQSGDHNIELIEVLSDSPSAFTECAATRGIHHCALFTEDYKAAQTRFAAAGYPIVSEFNTDFGAQICYVDTRALTGHYVEIYPEHPVIRDMYRQTRDAAAAWDGKGALIQPFEF